MTLHEKHGLLWRGSPVSSYREILSRFGATLHSSLSMPLIYMDEQTVFPASNTVHLVLMMSDQ